MPNHEKNLDISHLRCVNKDRTLLLWFTIFDFHMNEFHYKSMHFLLVSKFSPISFQNILKYHHYMAILIKQIKLFHMKLLHHSSSSYLLLKAYTLIII